VTAYRAYAYASRGKNCAVDMLKLTTDKHDRAASLRQLSIVKVDSLTDADLRKGVPFGGLHDE